jgi:hypothetical protein
MTSWAWVEPVPVYRGGTGAYERRLIPVVGHNLPQEAPREFAEAILTLVHGPLPNQYDGALRVDRPALRPARSDKHSVGFTGERAARRWAEQGSNLRP